MILGETLLGQSSQVYYRFSRPQAMTEWWQWLVLASVVLVVGSYVVWMYRRDSMELPRTTCWVLSILRLLVFAGILFFFLDLEKRTQQRLEKPSRVAVLADTSQSMAMPNAAVGSSDKQSRVGRMTSLLRDEPFMKGLRQRHDVLVYRFDETEQPTLLASFNRLSDPNSEGSSPEASRLKSLAQARRLVVLAAILGLVAIISWLVDRRWQANRIETSGDPPAAWGKLIAMVLVFAGLVVLAVSTLLDPELSLAQIIGLQSVQTSNQATKDATTESKDAAATAIEWDKALVPRGRSTRIGDALRQVIRRHRGEPLAGIVVITDGGQNQGLGLSTAALIAKESRIPIFPIGLGSDKKPISVRVVDLEAPQRVFPGDPFSLTGYLQSFGMNGRSVRATLVSAPEGSTNIEEEILEEERRVTLDEDGRISTLEFELIPEETGKRIYRLRVDTPEEDTNPDDDQQGAIVHVFERQNRILLLAGGPSREYRFLRNQLFRDRETELDVLLQSAPDGVSQDADQVLTDLPSTADEFFEYDAIVAFDPDWLAFDENQLELLERWVAEQAGGLIVVAGPIHTPHWSSLRRGRDRRADLVKAWYPVEFYSQGAPTLSLGRFGGENPWPVDFTRDGFQAEFLRLENDATESEESWADFEGVFGYYAVRDPKPGARVYGRFSDPETAIEDQLPIYLASHLYGAGRAFYQASGEMWRLRASDEKYFERYYTKLIRWVSQGRLLRDSTRGMLLIDKDRPQVGDQIEVRAILMDAQHQPLVRESVDAVLVHPDGERETIVLPAVTNATRDGTFAISLTLLKERDFRLELVPPEGTEEDLLSRVIQVRSTDREIASPQRQDAVLTELADESGGVYYIGIDAATGAQGDEALNQVIPSADQVTYVFGAPDSKFDKRLMIWLMVLISVMLFAEWIIRRLSKLA